MLLTRYCPGCGRAQALAARGVCLRCQRLLPPAPIALCDPGIVGPLGLDGLVAATGYDDLVGRLITAGKNGARIDVLRQFADRLAPRCPQTVDVIAWVPASRARSRRRGFDHGEVIASRLARRCQRPARQVLSRARGEAQRGGSRAARLIGPTIEARRPPAPRVLLVDDVMTTGASLAAAAGALRAAGTVEVYGAVLAAVAPRAASVS